MLLVAVITIEPGKLEEFRKYEQAAATIMARYNGVIERAIGLPGPVTLPKASTPAPKRGGIMGAIDEVATQIDRGIEKVLHPNDNPGYRELHILRFPDEAAFDAYSADTELVALASERAKYVVSTEIWRAEEGPRY